MNSCSKLHDGVTPVQFQKPSSCFPQSSCGEIFWPVSVEILKSKYVKQADGQQSGFGGCEQIPVDDTVDFPNNPHEEFIVDCLELKHI